MNADIARLRAETDRARQEMRSEPWKAMISLTSLVVAAFAAGAAYVKFVH